MEKEDPEQFDPMPVKVKTSIFGKTNKFTCSFKTWEKDPNDSEDCALVKDVLVSAYTLVKSVTGLLISQSKK